MMLKKNILKGIGTILIFILTLNLLKLSSAAITNSKEKIISIKIDFKIKNSNFYYNDKYEYGISYPKTWKSTYESPSGDGMQLLQENNIDIRVYGGYRIIPPDFENEKITKQRKKGSKIKISSNNGQKSALIIGNEGQKKLLEYIVIGKERFCEFYVLSSKDFIIKNEKILTEIAMTLHLDE